MSIHDILKQPIETNLLEHYIQYITMVQDWERIMVWKLLAKEVQKKAFLKYCYKREKGNKKWVRCPDSPGENNSYDIKKCKACKSSTGGGKETSYFDNLKNWIIEDEEEHLRGGEADFPTKSSKRKTFLEKIFTKRLILELDEREEAEYKEIRLIFEYPPYTIFPKDEYTSHKLGLYYERQQIEILRQLASKYKVLRHGIKAALSAIIVRNHSHHIGSHVMPRTTVEKVRKRVIELTGLQKDDKKLYEIVDTLKDKLDEYIQKKADFTAEIATEPLTTTKTMKFIDEVLTQFTANTLLMDNIGANEGVRYRDLDDNRLKIKFLRDGGDWLTLKYEPSGSCKSGKTSLEYTYSTKCFCGEELERLREDGKEKDISIALPGCLGEFAIYAFLENFIRNGIKHNKDLIDGHKEENFEISVDVCELGKDCEYKDEFYKLKIWDNFTKPEKKITVKNDNGNDGEIPLHQYLQRLISLQIVDNEGSLRKEAWGMAEMKIMATLLRGSTDFTNMAENLEITCEKKNGKKRLVYSLLIMKPKNVVIISDIEINNKNKSQNRIGIWWFQTIKELENHVLNGISPVSFKFLIIDKSGVNLDELKKIKHLLPFRIMIKAPGNGSPDSSKWYNAINEEDIDEIRRGSGSKILDLTWKAWMKEFLKKKNCTNPTLFIYFQQDKQTEPTKSWFNINKEKDEIIRLSVLANEENGIHQVSNNENLELACKGNILMYDRHFRGYKYLEDYLRDKNILTYDSELHKYEAALNRKGNNWIHPTLFHEAFDKGSSDFIHIFTKYSSPEMVYELVEAALLRVLVIDERIAEVAYNELNIEDDAYRAYGDVKRLHTARKTGVDICTHLCISDDKDPKPLHPSINRKSPIVCVKFDIERDSDSKMEVSTSILYCEEIPKKNKKGKCSECKGEPIKEDMDAVIIHQGVLEKFFEKVLQSSEYDTFLKALQESIPYVIVDSGRGIPAKLPDTAKFLPFSLIEDFLMKDRIAKYSLTKNIMSLVRRK
jgi:hypothetical protein